MSEPQRTSPVKRRAFLGGTLLAAGAALGAFVRRKQPPPATSNPSRLDSRFVYDVSEYEQTDPSLVRYRPAHSFQTGFTRVRRIAATSSGIWVAGDKSLKLFSAAGVVKRELPLRFTPHCLHVVADDEIFVGARDFYAVFNAAGKEVFRSPAAQPKSYFTALRAHRAAVYIADAGNREILICDRKSGEVIDRFGKADPSRNNPGFAIPSPNFNLEIVADRLRIANTGQTRIETYSLDGRFESAWGKPGMQIDRFCGCCNPVFFTTTPDGNYITSEKGLLRINIYSAAGAFIGAVAGPQTLVEDKDSIRRVSAEGDSGAAFDVAVDENRQVFALDPFNRTVRCFAPLDQT